MGLNYSIAMLKNPQNQDENAKAYAKSQITRELPLKELSRRVAAQTTASRADVTAVIIATVENMLDGLARRRTGRLRRPGEIPSSDHQPRGGKRGKIHVFQHHRSQHPVHSGRRFENHILWS